MDQSVIADLGRLLLLLVLIVVNGFFVAAEFSLVAVRRARVEQLASEGSAPAGSLKQAIEQIDHSIATTQLGVTIASLALGWLGGVLLADRLAPLLAGLVGPWVVVIAVILAFLLLAILHAVLGALVPRMLAGQRAEATALLIARPLAAGRWLLGPLVLVVNGAANGVARRLGLRPSQGADLAHTEDELRMLVTASQENGILEPLEEEMLHKVFTFADKEAHQVMVPRTEMAAVPAEMAVQEFLERPVEQHAHTRFPVFEGTLDSIVGILHLKDVIRAVADGQAGQPVRSVMRPVLVVPETIHIDELLRQLQRRRMHMAVLVDEYGGTAGLVTMEDLLEEIVGEIRDEFDVEEPGLADRHDGTWSVDGMMPIAEFNELFGQSIEDPTYDTIAGHVFGLLGRVAEVGDEVVIDGLVLRVEAMDGLRIASLRVLPQPGRTLVVDDADFVDEPDRALPQEADSTVGSRQ